MQIQCDPYEGNPALWPFLEPSEKFELYDTSLGFTDTACDTNT
jgi:hypothetical protein